MSLDPIVATVIGDIGVVFVASSLLGAAARKCGQPAVIGQILTGVLLGPTVLGRLPGDLTARLFPAAVLPYLTVLAQVAIVVFMFVIGYELDLRALRGTGRAVPLIAASALFVPMLLGSGAVLAVKPLFHAAGETNLTHSLIIFMGVAVSITALPVMAAIIRDRGLAGTVAAVTGTTAAGIMDVVAWLALAAALVGTAHATGRPWLVTFGLITAFVLAMLLVVRPALRWWLTRERTLLHNHLAIAIALALGSAWVTASLGLHPVFGGFLAGLAMPSPDGAPETEVLRPMEEIGAVLLPLFFVVTGLSLRIGGVDSKGLELLGIICAIAIVGKIVPGYAASRLGGLGPRDSAAVAALVNTRGLTELIALNVGLSDGLINQRLFTILVLMALLTTLLTSPLLSLIRISGQPVTDRAGAEIPASG